jgi:RNA 2',3'-cyclic 3'-phosphodiesterase
MRLFIGIELSDDVKAAAAVAAGRLRDRLAREAPSALLRWVGPENLHITLWFLGEVRDPDAEALVTAMERPFEARPFPLRLAGAGAFPESGAPRAVWLGLAAGREGLLAIHDRLTRILRPLGHEPEKRPYSPHLTVARVKDVRRSDVPALRRVLREGNAQVGECDVRHVTLFRSRLSPKGSQYERVLRVPLE